MPGPFSFTGQRLDPQTGLLYYNARYYDPVAGRFTSTDKVENNTTGKDPYAYVGDSPETKVDPTGNRHMCSDDPSGECSDGSGGAPSGGSSSGPAPAPAHSGGGGGGGGGSDSGSGGGGGNVVSGIEQGASTVLDALTGIPSMVHDVQTVFDGNKSWQDRTVAFFDFGVNATMDVSMLFGVGEAARGLYFAAHVGGDLIEHAGADVVEHAVADTAEQAASDTAEQVASSCGGGLSFLASTSVATSTGARAIGSLHPGDQVWAYNPTSKKMELEPVLHVWINHDNDLVDLTITKTASTHQGKASKPISEVIHTNKKHPFLTVEKGFLPVGQITLGMHIVEADGQVGVVSGWKVVPGVMTMYNLEVAQDHTFTVGVGEWVVHNCGKVNAGDAGAYKNLLGEKGDGLTPHHMPQGSLAQHFGFNYREGGAVVMDQATHQLTYNYSGLANGTKSVIINGGYTFRQALAESIRDYRSLVPNSNGSVRQLIEYWNNTYPQLMQK